MEPTQGKPVKPRRQRLVLLAVLVISAAVIYRFVTTLPKTVVLRNAPVHRYIHGVRVGYSEMLTRWPLGKSWPSGPRLGEEISRGSEIVALTIEMGSPLEGMNSTRIDLRERTADYKFLRWDEALPSRDGAESSWRQCRLHLSQPAAGRLAKTVESDSFIALRQAYAADGVADGTLVYVSVETPTHSFRVTCSNHFPRAVVELYQAVADEVYLPNLAKIDTAEQALPMAATVDFK
jgi:hypothetical protein